MQKVLLLILDGWGYRKEKRSNAILQAKTPAFNNLMRKYPHTLLKASDQQLVFPRSYGKL